MTENISEDFFLHIGSLFNCVLNGLVFIQIFSISFFLLEKSKLSNLGLLEFYFQTELRYSKQSTILMIKMLFYSFSLSLCHEVISIVKLFDEKCKKNSARFSKKYALYLIS